MKEIIMRGSLRIFICVLILTFFANSAWTQCEALFTFDETDLSIQFTDLSTSDAGDPIVSWFWDFDDGSTSTEQNPLHIFSTADKYDVVLTITTDSGCESTLEIRIEICAFSVNVQVGDCDPNGDVPIDITVNDIFDNAKDIDISFDGILIPGSPFEIDQENPVMVTHSIPGDGLMHQINIQSTDISTCSKVVDITVDDCSSDCFLSSLSTSLAGGTTHVVDVGDNFFEPSNVTIEIADIVEFSWVGDGHSTTSDATSGPDSWNSGVIGFGATYNVELINPGVHPYYCIPHGGPGGSGMSGSIIANCPNGNQFNLDIGFNTTIADPAGFDVLIDGVTDPGSPFPYAGTGPQSVQISVAGDGLEHTITIVDVADPTCDIETTWQAPDCGAAPSCNLSLSATENGPCNPSNNVPVEVIITAINEGQSGFNILVDGQPDPGNPYSYTPGGTTTIQIDVPGDGQSHTITAEDIDDNACSGSTDILTTNCTIPCALSNLSASTGSSVTHSVLVEDFQFTPQNITITDGDLIEWQWTGDVQHTTTSDATSGPDSWDSGLLGLGATYLSPVLSAGLHPYYCIPHGGPGGSGMAGTITVQANCTGGMVSVAVSFDEQGGGFNGFEVLVDDVVVGSFSYDPSGTNTVNVNVIGDGLNHNIEVRDVDDIACSVSTSITTPDCNASTCQLTVTATENGPCDANDNVSVQIEVSDVGGGNAGFNLFLDGGLVGNYDYEPGGTTTIQIDVPG